MEKLSKEQGQSLNLKDMNVSIIKKLFPEAFSEDKLNFETLKEMLASQHELVTEKEASYSFNWFGKNRARQIALLPTTGTLRPQKQSSYNWDNTSNVFIEGDNLEVLKILQKSHHKKIKMIYIDPPYNTGKDFVYKDNFQDNIGNYKSITNQIDVKGNQYSANAETSGRYHTNWLNMMYPRLMLAKNLLRDDGVIFMSIDDNEVANLRKICDEIFGEDNFLANVVWQKKYAATNDAKGFSNLHDHILVYRKSSEFERYLLPRTAEQNKPYKHDDEDGKGLWRSDNLLVRSFSQSGVYPIRNPNTGEDFFPPEGSCWRASRDTMKVWLEENRIYFGKDGKGAPQLKRYLNEVQQGRVPSTWWTFDEVGHNDAANKELKSLFNKKPPFDTPKPTTLIMQMLTIATKDDDIVLDFFAGSSTTAHAVMKQNIIDGGNRKFIMVQIPEPCAEKSEGARVGFQSIAEISRERIRLAIEQLKNEAEHDGLVQSFGFKTFSLDSTNIHTWDSNPEDLVDLLDNSIESIKEDRTPEDVLYEIILKYGLDLTYPVSTYNLVDKTVYSVAFGSLIVCLDDDISIETVEAIGKLKQELDSESTRVVFSDSGFTDDAVKVNAVQLLKQYGIDDVKSI